MTPLHLLPAGQGVFIQMHNKFYTGVVTTHYEREHTVQVKTDCANQIRAKWQHLVFRWADGKCNVWRDAVSLIVPTTQAEVDDLNEKVRKSQCAFPEQLGLEAEEPTFEEPMEEFQLAGEAKDWE